MSKLIKPSIADINQDAPSYYALVSGRARGGTRFPTADAAADALQELHIHEGDYLHIAREVACWAGVDE